MRDAISFARRNIPAVALITTEFWEQGHFVARAVGMPDVPRLVLPHPVAGSGRAAMASLADSLSEPILRALTILI